MSTRGRAERQGGGRGSRKDPAWKYGEQVKMGEGKTYIYIKCNFCSQVITGGVKRMKDHLAGTSKNVKPCTRVPEDVKQEIQAFLASGERHKVNRREEFNEQCNIGSYYSAPSSNPSSGAGSSRGIRGPMDRFMATPPIDVEVDQGIEVQEINPGNIKEYRNKVCLDIGRFFIENGIAFNVARSPSFYNMVRSIENFGRNLKPPSMHELSTWVLDEEVNTTRKTVEEVKKTWAHTGVTIMSDGWTDIRGRSIINFLVNNPEGTIFLKSIDASNMIKDKDMFFKLLDGLVEEIGEDIVVQVVTDNAASYKAVGEELMKKRERLYWTPCAAHCIDLMLEKIGDLPEHKYVLLKAKQVANYIYAHGWVLALMRSFTSNEIIRPAATRFATAYLTLQSLCNAKMKLQEMFTSEKWTKSSYAKKADGKAVKKIIMNDNHFWPAVLYTIRSTKPLVNVLKMVDSEKVPAMGFLYGAMDKAKEEIARNLGADNEENYKEIWDIIDTKWDYQMHRPLHAAAYYLNPQFHYEDDFSTHVEIKDGLFQCMDKMIPKEDRNTADLQLDRFHAKQGFFGRANAQGTRKSRPPAVWWSTFGDEVPELQRFAIKVLSLTCTASACERNWSTFNQVHTKRRNRLSTNKMNNLVYVMYNKMLMHRHLKRMPQEGDDVLLAEELASDNEWLVDEEVETLNQAQRLQLTQAIRDENELEGLEANRGRAHGSGSSKRRKIATSSRNRGKGTQVTQGKGKGKRPAVIDEEEEWSDNGDDDESEDDRAIQDCSMDDPSSGSDGDASQDQENDWLY